MGSKIITYDPNIAIIKTGKHPTKLETLASRVSKKEITAPNIDKFKNYVNIISIKNECSPTAELNQAATIDEMNKIIKCLDA